MNVKKNFFLLSVIPLSFLFLFLISVVAVSAQTCSNTAECQSLIEEYTQKLNSLKTQSNTLSNQIAQFNTQISLTTLKIKQTEEQIKLLGGRIDQLEGSLSALSSAFSSRAVETYKMSRAGESVFLVLSANNIGEAVSRYHYLQKIQEADRNLLIRLQTAQNTYKVEKGRQEELAELLDQQKRDLTTQKAAKANLLAVTKNDEKKYQQLLATAKAQLAAFSRFVASQGGASILSNQTKCDGWGCYYNQRDSLWGNMGLGGSSYSVAGYGCLVSSVSMIASHSGRNIKPNDIAANSSAFVPGTGYLNWSFNVNGMGVSISSASKGELDQRLNNGPVIAGLYGGPDHFIVILKKEGDNYIMHDPFLENGSNRPLTDRYNVSDISSLRIVSFN
ncbi:MAG: cysteine peptidase family C39 domain-containing protein [Patescibacteria group bacterium]